MFHYIELPMEEILFWHELQVLPITKYKQLEFSGISLLSFQHKLRCYLGM